jgi:hypothetical protein
MVVVEIGDARRRRKAEKESGRAKKQCLGRNGGERDAKDAQEKAKTTEGKRMERTKTWQGITKTRILRPNGFKAAHLPSSFQNLWFPPAFAIRVNPAFYLFLLQSCRQRHHFQLFLIWAGMPNVFVRHHPFDHDTFRVLWVVRPPAFLSFANTRAGAGLICRIGASFISTAIARPIRFSRAKRSAVRFCLVGTMKEERDERGEREGMRGTAREERKGERGGKEGKK